MEGFIRGGHGEVPLVNILGAQLSGFSTRAMQEAAAVKYEAEHAGAIVRRPWESDAEHAARREKRQIAQVAQPTSGMDPARAEKELGRLNAQLAGLTPDHPEYKKLFTNLVREINAREFDCGLPQTAFALGEKVERPTEVVSPEAQAKLEKYGAQTRANKTKSIAATSDVEFLKLIRDTEQDTDLVLAATLRITQLTT
jgi:hypothetical protein